MSGFSAFDWLTFLTILFLTFSLFLVITGAFTAYFGSGKSRKIGVGLLVGGVIVGVLWAWYAGPPPRFDPEHDSEGLHRDRGPLRRAPRHHRGPYHEAGHWSAGERQAEPGRRPERFADAAGGARGRRRPRPGGERSHPRSGNPGSPGRAPRGETQGTSRGVEKVGPRRLPNAGRMMFDANAFVAEQVEAIRKAVP